MRSLRNALFALPAAALLAAAPVCAAEVVGAGTAFLAPAVAKWSDGSKAAGGDTASYRPVGSGGAIRQIKDGSVDFAVADMPLLPDDLREGGLMQFPVVMGGVVAIVNLPGIGPGQIHIDGPTLAAIYLGRVTRWDDPAITRVNPGLSLPATTITPVHQADTSGSTLAFTAYLSQMSPEWRDKVGVAPLVAWPGGLGGKESDSAFRLAATIPGAIAYGKMSTAQKLGLSWTVLASHDGTWVTPDAESIQSAAATADWSRAPLLVNQPGAKSWPITGISYGLVRVRADKPERTQAALRFLHYAFTHGDVVTQTSNVPLPVAAVKAVEDGWARNLHSADGASLWPAK